MKRSIISFDLETTGTNIATDRIVEFGFIKINPDGSQIKKVRKINPEILIPKEVSEIHGITDKDVINEPTFKQVGADLHSIIDGCDLIGYNLKRFDIPILIEEFLRIGIEWDLTGINIWDSYEVEKELNPRTLSATYKRYMGVALEDAHSALSDSIASYEIMKKQLDIFSKLNPKLSSMENISDYFLNKKKPYKFCFEFYQDEEGVIRFNIGKHKDKCVYNYPDYLNWMFNSNFSMHTKNIIKELLK